MLSGSIVKDSNGNESMVHSPTKNSNSQLFNNPKKWSNHNGGSNHSNGHEE